jgi:hypothetical protein
MRDAAGLGADRIDFRTTDVYAVRPRDIGTFQVVLVLGLVYHVEDPMGLFRRARALTSPGGICVVESQLTRQHEPIEHGWGRSEEVEHAAGAWAVRIEQDSAANPVASFGGVASFIPNAAALETSLLAAGFASVEWCNIDPAGSPQYVRGDRGLVIART